MGDILGHLVHPGRLQDPDHCLQRRLHQVERPQLFCPQIRYSSIAAPQRDQPSLHARTRLRKVPPHQPEKTDPLDKQTKGRIDCLGRTDRTSQPRTDTRLCKGRNHPRLCAQSLRERKKGLKSLPHACKHGAQTPDRISLLNSTPPGTGLPLARSRRLCLAETLCFLV